MNRQYGIRYAVWVCIRDTISDYDTQYPLYDVRYPVYDIRCTISEKLGGFGGGIREEIGASIGGSGKAEQVPDRRPGQG